MPRCIEAVIDSLSYHYARHVMSNVAPAIVTGVCTVSAGVLALIGAIMLRAIDVRSQHKSSWRETRLQTASEFVTAVQRHRAELHTLYKMLDGSERQSERALLQIGYPAESEDAIARQLKLDDIEADIIALVGRIELLFPRHVVDLADRCSTALQATRTWGVEGPPVLDTLGTFIGSVKTVLQIPDEADPTTK